MVLVDTSVWVDHLRSGDDQLATLLDTSQVLLHPFVMGEIAMGSLRQRTTILSALHNLPRVTTATDEEVLGLVDSRKLHGLGIGHVDAHLLASVLLMPGIRLWTRDRRLHAVALDHGLAFSSRN